MGVGRVHKMLISIPGDGPSVSQPGAYSYAGDDFTIHAAGGTVYKSLRDEKRRGIRLVVDMADLSTMTVMSRGPVRPLPEPALRRPAETWAKGGQESAPYTSAEKLSKVLSLVPAKR